MEKEDKNVQNYLKMIIYMQYMKSVLIMKILPAHKPQTKPRQPTTLYIKKCYWLNNKLNMDMVNHMDKMQKNRIKEVTTKTNTKEINKDSQVIIDKHSIMVFRLLT